MKHRAAPYHAQERARDGRLRDSGRGLRMTQRLDKGGLSSTSRTRGFQDGTHRGRPARNASPKSRPARVAAARIDEIENCTLGGWLFFSVLVLVLSLLTSSPLWAGDLPIHSRQAEQAQNVASFAAGTALGTAFVGSDPAGADRATREGADTATHNGMVSQTRDAGLYLDTEIALGSGSLKPYAFDKRDRNASLLPGLAGIASHVLREQRLTMADNQRFTYSLADAMADALWRKQVVDALYRKPDVGSAN